MKTIKVLFPLVAIILGSCFNNNTPSSSGIKKPTNTGKEVSEKTVTLNDKQVTFRQGMSKEELLLAVNEFKTPGLGYLFNVNADFEFNLKVAKGVSYSANGEMRYYLDSVGAKHLSKITKCGNVAHYYGMRANPSEGESELYDYSLRSSKLIYVYGIDVKDDSEYYNENIDNSKADEDKNHAHATRCVADYNNFFFDSYETVTVSSETETLEFTVQVSYKITEKYLIVETNRPHGIYAKITGTEMANYMAFKAASTRSDLYYKQTRYYNFETQLLEYHDINVKTVTCNYQPLTETSFSARFAYLEAGEEGKTKYNEISQYVKENSTKHGIIY